MVPNCSAKLIIIKKLLLLEGRRKEKRFKESYGWDVNSFTGRKISQMKNAIRKGRISYN